MNFFLKNPSPSVWRPAGHAGLVLRVKQHSWTEDTNTTTIRPRCLRHIPDEVQRFKIRNKIRWLISRWECVFWRSRSASYFKKAWMIFVARVWLPAHSCCKHWELHILTQRNIKGLKAFENHTGRNGNIKFTQPRRAHTCTMTSNATFAGVHGLKWTRGRSWWHSTRCCVRDTTFSFKTLLSALIICFVHSTSRSQQLGTQYSHLFSPQLLTYIHRDDMAQGSGPALPRQESFQPIRHSTQCEDPCTLRTKYTVH